MNQPWAFLIVMSPEAEQSEWVQKEVLLAKRYRRPIFPLLLRGEEMPILIDLQFADVKNGEMPGPDFYRRVTRSIYGS
jgi:TIR domain-containing protein